MNEGVDPSSEAGSPSFQRSPLWNHRPSPAELALRLGFRLLDSAKRNTEETRFVDRASLTSNNSASSPSDLANEETDTFDDDYNRNIDLTQRYLEKIKAREDDCFRSCLKSESFKSLIRRHSPQRLAEQSKSATTSSASDLERKSPIPKLRLRTAASSSRQVQIAERPKGNAVHLGEEIANR
jgi:hypothetical protein